MYWLPAILILPYFLLLLYIYRNLRKILPFNISSSPSTFVSVIIACRNEQDNIPTLLGKISHQDYPKELYEVIIVDDNSTDKTFDTASARDFPAKLHVLKNMGQGKKEAIGTGISAASGRLIITTDADCTMGKSWISTIAALFEKDTPDMIICPVQLEGNDSLSGKFQQLEYLGLQGITAGAATSGHGIMCNGANLAFTRDTWLRHMDNLHMDLQSGDDVFLLHSLKKDVSSKIVWLESPEALVTTASSSSLLSFLRQRRRWISKWSAYNDSFTILTGMVVFAAIVSLLGTFAACFFNIIFLRTFLTILILKSIPDFLILLNTTGRYGKRKLMPWFLPSQLIYPLYVMAVVLYSLIPAPGSSSSSPFRKGI